MINMGYLDPIPLNPENATGGKSTVWNPPLVSAAEEGTWFKGDATKKRIVNSRTEVSAADGSVVKALLRGDLYNVRQNGYSAINDTVTVPFEGIDGSYFTPGVPGKMTNLQERAFFKHAEHDEQNRTLVSRVLQGDFIHGNQSGKRSKSKLPNTTGFIARNRLEASKPSSRSVSAMEKRAGRDFSSADTRPAQRRAADKIADSCADLIDPKAKFQVIDYLTKSSKETRNSLEELFASIQAASRTKGAPLTEYTGRSTGSYDVVRPGTAAVMERSERDVQQAVAQAALAESYNLTAAGEKRISTPKFGAATLHKGRLMGHRAECTGKFGYVPTSEERVRDLRKMLRDFIYMKAKDMKAAWRWFDPDALGYVDAQGLYCIAQEFMIDCTMEEVTALHRMLDVDGDGVMSYEDFALSMFDTAVQERDYFLVCQKPAFNIANEVMIFQDDDEALGDSLRPEWGQMSLLDMDGPSKTLPYDRAYAPRPTTSVERQPARHARPGTAATEIHEFARSARPGTAGTENHELTPSNHPRSRPSTGLGVRSLKQRQNQIWGDAARIAALTGGKDSVDSIKKVLDVMHPISNTSAEMRSDLDRPLSRVGSTASREIANERKPGIVPRGISADEARLLMAKRTAHKDTLQPGPTMQVSAPHQPAGPRRQKTKVITVKPPRSFVVARPPAAAAVARADKGPASSLKTKPVPSSLFLMSASPAGGIGTAPNCHTESAPPPSKMLVGLELNRS